MRKSKLLPELKEVNVEPKEASKELTFNEVKEKMAFHWREIEKSSNYEAYFEAWINYDYYMDLKMKFSPKTSK